MMGGCEDTPLGSLELFSDLRLSLERIGLGWVGSCFLGEVCFKD